MACAALRSGGLIILSVVYQGVQIPSKLVPSILYQRGLARGLLNITRSGIFHISALNHFWVQFKPMKKQDYKLILEYLSSKVKRNGFQRASFSKHT